MSLGSFFYSKTFQYFFPNSPFWKELLQVVLTYGFIRKTIDLIVQEYAQKHNMIGLDQQLFQCSHLPHSRESMGELRLFGKLRQLWHPPVCLKVETSGLRTSARIWGILAWTQNYHIMSTNWKWNFSDTWLSKIRDFASRHLNLSKQKFPGGLALYYNKIIQPAILNSFSNSSKKLYTDTDNHKSKETEDCIVYSLQPQIRHLAAQILFNILLQNKRHSAQHQYSVKHKSIK